MLIKPLPLLVHFDLLVAVLDESAIRNFVARQYRKKSAKASSTVQPTLLGGPLSIGQVVSEALIFANRNPLPHLYGISFPPGGSRTIQNASSSMVGIRQEVVVLDELALWQFALQQYRACWRQEMANEKDAEDMTLDTAVLEAVVLSNCNPSPVDYGLEIDDFQSYVSAGLPRSYQEVATLLGERTDMEHFLRVLRFMMQHQFEVFFQARLLHDAGQAFWFLCFDTLDFLRYHDTEFMLSFKRAPRQPDPELIQIARMVLARWQNGSFSPPDNYPYSYEATIQSLKAYAWLTVPAEAANDDQ